MILIHTSRHFDRTCDSITGRETANFTDVQGPLTSCFNNGNISLSFRVSEKLSCSLQKLKYKSRGILISAKTRLECHLSQEIYPVGVNRLQDEIPPV